MVAIKLRAALRRMLSDGFTNSNLPTAIDRGAAASFTGLKPAFQSADRIGRYSLDYREQSARKRRSRMQHIRHPLTRSGKVQI
jgi:hypothetical protein